MNFGENDMNSYRSLSRRDFLRYVSAGAGALACAGVPVWTGCRAQGSHAGSALMQPRFDPDQDIRPLLSEEAFRAIVNATRGAAKIDSFALQLRDVITDVTRFDLQQIFEDRSQSRPVLKILVEAQGQRGFATANELTPDAAAAAVKNALAAAQDVGADSALATIANLQPQRYFILPTFRLDTARADARRRACAAERAVAELASFNAPYTGALSTTREIVGVANNRGLFAYEARTRAELLLKIGASPRTLPIAAVNRSIDDLEIVESIRRWTAAWHVHEQEQFDAPGLCTLVLGPEAAAQLAYLLLESAAARDVSSNASPADLPQIAPEITIRNDPQQPALLGRGFNDLGCATDARAWFEHGKYVRRTTDDAILASLPDALNVFGENPRAANTAALIKSVDQGLYIAAFDAVDPKASTPSAFSTRSRLGVFRIENGALTGVVRRELRIDPSRTFVGVSAYSSSLPAVINSMPSAGQNSSTECVKTLAPAMLIEDFDGNALSTQTRA